MAVDLSVALDAVITAFGETVSYTPSGGTAESINGVFNTTFQEVDAATGATLMSERPNLLIRESDLSTGAAGEGDQVTVNSTTYKVIERQPDNEGGALLLLHEAS